MKTRLVKQLVVLGIFALSVGARWWDPRCPPCPAAVVCRGEPCFMGQRCDEDRGCLPRVVGERGFSDDTRSLTLGVTGQGGVVLAGSYEPPRDADGLASTQTLLARLDPQGDMKWSASFGATGHSDSGEQVRIDDEGGIWVAGSFQGGEISNGNLRAAGPGGVDLFVMKLMGGGRPLWLQAYGTPGDDRLFDIEVGEEGNGYLVSGTGDDHFTIQRIRADGSAGWVKELPGNAPALGLYREDQIYVAASFTAPTIKVDWQELSLAKGERTGIWLARFDWDGDLVWARTLDGDGSARVRGIQDIEALNDGDIVVSGFDALGGFPEVRSDGRIFVARLSPAGTPESVTRFGPPAASNAPVHASLVPGRHGRVHVCGTFDGRFLWDGVVPRPDLDAGRFVGTIEADGGFGAALLTPRRGAVLPTPAARDDAGRLHLVTGGGEAPLRLLTVEP